jgi:hypothetical protein
MNEPFLEFEWGVWPAYEWSDFRNPQSRAVIVPSRGLASLESPSAVELAWERLELKGEGSGPVLRPVTLSEPERYCPMSREHAALFRTFGELDYQDRDVIRGFASKFGMLGIESRSRPGESHLNWAREICLMREALQLAQPMTPAAEAEDLKNWAQHDAEMRAFSKGQGRDDDPVEYRRDEDRRKLAWLFNVHLQYVQARMIVDAESGPRLRIAPLTLLGAMWLQLALSLVGDKRFVACKFCRRFFEISTAATGFRSHREFCTDICKTNDYRRRKRIVLEMAEKGKSIRDIVAATDTKSSTIRAWVAGIRSRHHRTEKTGRSK